MSAFTYEKTFTYIYSRNKYVAVRKHLIVKDEEGQRFAIFQLVNTYHDVLTQVGIKVEQYDRDGNLIKTNDIPYEGLSIKHHGRFVPFFKLALDARTTRLQATLVAAKFEGHAYTNGKLYRIKKAKKEVEKKEKEVVLKDSIDKRYNALSSKSPVKSFLIMSIIALVISALLIGLFSLTNRIYVYNDFEYNISSGSLVAYTGDSGTVSVPKSINNVEITSIGEKAFMNTSVVNVTLESPSITIGDNAFSNCKMLKEIKGKDVSSIGTSAFENCYALNKVQFDEIKVVGKSAFRNCRALKEFNYDTCEKVLTYAFVNCTTLEKVRVPKATMSTNVFLGNIHLTDFVFGDTEGYYSRLYTIFSNETNFNNLSVGTYMKNVDENFLDDFVCGRLNFLNPQIALPLRVQTKWNELATSKGAIIKNGGYTKVFDVITEFDSTNDFLVLSDTSIQGITLEAWYSIARGLRVIDCNNYINFTKEMLSECTNLTELYLGTNNTIDNGAISSVDLYNMKIPACGKKFTDLFKVMPNNLLTIRINGNKKIGANYFSNCSFVDSVIFEQTVINFEENCINNCANLSQIVVEASIPSFERGFIGKGCTRLREVQIPYVQLSDGTLVKYSELNSSAANTVKIVLNSNTAIALCEGCFENCTKLEYILSYNGFTSGTKNILKGKASLAKMRIDGNVGSSFNTLIGETSIVTNVLFNNCRAFPEGYFKNVKNTNVYLGYNTYISESLVQEGDKLKALYLSSYVSRGNDYLTKLDKVDAVREVYDMYNEGFVANNFEFHHDPNIDSIMEGLFN